MFESSKIVESWAVESAQRDYGYYGERKKHLPVDVERVVRVDDLLISAQDALGLSDEGLADFFESRDGRHFGEDAFECPTLIELDLVKAILQSSIPSMYFTPPQPEGDLDQYDREDR